MSAGWVLRCVRQQHMGHSAFAAAVRHEDRRTWRVTSSLGGNLHAELNSCRAHDLKSERVTQHARLNP
jgi:hypothetical protein